jgi:hypothetical protein
MVMGACKPWVVSAASMVKVDQWLLGVPFRHAFSTRSPVIVPRHLRAGATLIQKHQLLRVDLAYGFPPRLPALLRFRRFLLLGVE